MGWHLDAQDSWLAAPYILRAMSAKPLNIVDDTHHGRSYLDMAEASIPNPANWWLNSVGLRLKMSGLSHVLFNLTHLCPMWGSQSTYLFIFFTSLAWVKTEHLNFCVLFWLWSISGHTFFFLDQSTMSSLLDLGMLPA